VERDLLAWILVGLVVGLLAKLLLPGRDPGGFVVALLLGIAGALAAGFLARAMRGDLLGLVEGLAWAGIGAFLLLIVYRAVVHARTR
jgi:uncharacterized membrane protein YeaQ/YmgE (transglycosylase-associated protein family)